MEMELSSEVKEELDAQVSSNVKSRGIKRVLWSTSNTYESADAKARNTVLPADKDKARFIRAKASHRLDVLKVIRRNLYMGIDTVRDPMTMGPQEWVRWMLDTGADFSYIIEEANWWESICAIRASDEEEQERWRKRVQMAKTMQVVQG